MRALVTGSTGFIGNHLLLRLIEDRWDVFCIVSKAVTPTNSRVIILQADLPGEDASSAFIDRLH